MTDLKIISYLIKWDEQRLMETTITCTKYDKDGEPELWAVKRGDQSMSKSTGEFCYDPRNSSKTAKFYSEFRFKDKTRALKYYNKFHKD